MNLVIVESPTKAKTISRFLSPKEYQILSSSGHIRDLPKAKLGIEVLKNFKPQYVIPAKARVKIKPLKTAAQKADALILATDEDREGEAIAWHLLHVLGKKDYQRIAFHEITKKAILEALKNPRQIDINLVNAQQARRILDRLVGYKLSPFLWKKISRGLSAGRVQSVAVRLIVQREKEIEKFLPREYWSLEAEFKEKFSAALKSELKNQSEVSQVLKNLEGEEYLIKNIENRESKRNPLAPFTTSTLQQEAARRLKMSARQTMLEAQKLYEKGLITYHRTDAVNLSSDFIVQAEKFLESNYFAAKKFKNRSKNAQEAHEAIRPTKITRIIKDNGLYNLIWQRAVASQMKPALLIEQTVDISAGKYRFRANGQRLKFDGFLKIYPLKISENILPELKSGQKLNLQKLHPQQHFTQPPARYSEGSLVKTLEKLGIGRPSTYATIIYTILKRGYVRKDRGRFKPQDVGIAVCDLLVKNFPDIVDDKFTARMETDLDKIAQGKREWQPVIKEFYDPFIKNLEEKYDKVQKVVETTDEKCGKCGKMIIIKFGRFGKFMACSGFPECKNTKAIINSLGIKCPQCEKGELLEKRVRKSGKTFWGCNRYPQCNYATWNDPRKEKLTEK